MLFYKQIDAYPGELIRLAITPYNEKNCVTAATFQILESYINASDIDVVRMRFICVTIHAQYCTCTLKCNILLHRNAFYFTGYQCISSIYANN